MAHHSSSPTACEVMKIAPQPRHSKIWRYLPPKSCLIFKFLSVFFFFQIGLLKFFSFISLTEAGRAGCRVACTIFSRLQLGLSPYPLSRDLGLSVSCPELLLTTAGSVSALSKIISSLNGNKMARYSKAPIFLKITVGGTYIVTLEHSVFHHAKNNVQIF